MSKESLTQEIIPIPGYEEYYGATTGGSIYSYNYKKTGETKELAQSSLFDKRRNSETFYKRVKAYFIDTKSPVAVHRLIALTFIPNPDSKPQVNHIDGDKGNNRADNLEWCTNAENVRHAESAGLSGHPRGEEHGCHKLTEKEVIEIKEELNAISPYKGQLMEIGEKYGVSNHCIFDIKKGRSWAHLK